MTEAPEKRRHLRVEFNEAVRVQPVLPSGADRVLEVQEATFHARALDLSEGGLRLEMGEAPRPDFLLKLGFEIADHPLEVYGRIVWTEGNRCGVRFMISDPVIQAGVKALSEKRS
jgi:hypothetical protein